MDVDSELIGEGDNQQIVLYEDSITTGDILAVIDVNVDDGWIA